MLSSTPHTSSWTQRWNNYWFQPAPLFNLAVCRIIIVTFQVLYIVRRDYLNEILSRADLTNSPYEPVLIVRLLTLPWGASTPPPDLFLSGMFWVAMISGIFSIVGFKTNLSLWGCALSNLFIQAYLYSFGEHHHSQALMMMSLLILALSPSGKMLSIDDLQHRLRRNIKQKRFAIFHLLDENSLFARWPLLLIQWMYAFVYMSAAVAKLADGGPAWLNGYTLQFYLLQDGLTWDRDLGILLAQNHGFALISSWAAVLFEATFFLVLIFPKLAWLYIPLGASFHTGIYLAQMAPFFQYVTIYVVFIPWKSALEIISNRLGLSRSTPKPEILYDGQCPLCIRSMTVLCYFDWFKRLQYSDLEGRWQSLAESHPHIPLEALLDEMHLILPNGAVRKGFFAFRAILRYLPPLWPLLLICYFPGTSKIGPKIYKFIADRRPKFQRCSFDTCSIDSSEK